MSLVASHPFEGGTAFLRVSGTLADPTVALDSTPSLPDAEILSRVLFGNASGDLSLIEQAQLSEALAAFATGRDLDLVGAVRDRLGLDRLNVSSDEDQTALVTGGRYIGRDVYVEVTAGASEAFQSTRISWRLRPNLVFRSEISRERDANLSLRWALDF